MIFKSVKITICVIPTLGRSSINNNVHVYIICDIGSGLDMSFLDNIYAMVYYDLFDKEHSL